MPGLEGDVARPGARPRVRRDPAGPCAQRRDRSYEQAHQRIGLPSRRQAVCRALLHDAPTIQPPGRPPGMNLDFQTLDPDMRYKLLVGLIVPRPIAFVSTYNENGVANCAPFSFFNVVSHEPPLVIISFGVRDNEGKSGGMKDTPRNILRTGEFVVNMVEESIAKGMHVASGEFSDEESE